MPYHLLAVGEARSFSTAIEQLRSEFEVAASEKGHQALDNVLARRPDLVLLDLDLPDMPGMTFLRALRATGPGKDIPLIVLSARKSDESVAESFSLGADDYLAKPFDPRELVVRVRAVLRRKYERAEHWGSALSIAGVQIDPSQRRCIVDGKRITLRPREFELLEILMRKAGRILTRAYLLETIWDMSRSADTRAVDVMVSRLRKRLGQRAGGMIETISKMGYCFASPE